jgi:hypothetical protein
MNKSQQVTPPWYKQFWPWFLIAVPIISLALGITMLMLAINTEDSLVVDDYYKQGKAINNKLEKIRNAKTLNIRTEITFLDNKVELRFLSEDLNQGAALTLEFYHATQSERDFSLNLTQQANGIYQAPLENALAGKWRIGLLPYHREWKVQQDFILPRSGPIIFEP